MKLVLLWTDLALWLMVAAIAAYALRVRRQPHLRATWERVLRDPIAASAGVVMAAFLLVTMIDSVHLRRALPVAAGEAAVYDTRTLSTLDLLLERQIGMREVSYSLPLGTHGFNKESVVEPDGSVRRDYPRLKFAGAHLSDPATQWARDVAMRAGSGLAAGLGVALLLVVLSAGLLARRHGGWRAALADLAADRTVYPLRAILVTLTVLLLLAGAVVALMPWYHVFGTDRTGNDVLVQALKSVRTAFVVGALSTLATLPFALLLGVLAGYYKGWVDDVIQYLYTTLSSVPNVLLIAACVLMVQVYFDKNPDAFETAVERSDVKMLMLCLILGLTGWAGLCRLVRAETLKLRELDHVQAATAFGVGDLRIMARHIVPNVMHLVLITVVLSFSELILYEAVLTYVGVGVDPVMNSFGGMINLARSEMSRDPVVWWSFAAAFGFMVSLVLAANLFADGVRDAFNPKARSTRPRVLQRRANHA
ncbi:MULTISPECIES: ABC transporter permease [unclassified Roseateles]|uniref:ABC transporter permease n=1 Tax=unclassified Roseateles TaxID=2626991 RepID=UPI000701DEDE|nr:MULTISPECIES: ABC transporter permease [unclassified Roseateles]KQW42405.1 peptide ABC transporter permease [Pelomonas sp. Root405]KRA68279.1 peptide ABC transporter permease [Pelomonas sp. Root662]